MVLDNRKTVQIWTDGSTQGGNPGKGGWAGILTSNGNLRVLGNYIGENITNNYAETYAFYNTIGVLNQPCYVVTWTDSHYVIFGMKRILEGRKLLKTNKTIWSDIKDIYLRNNHHFVMEFTKGHSTDDLNNLADVVAKYCALSGQRYDARFKNAQEAIDMIPVIKKMSKGLK